MIVILMQNKIISVNFRCEKIKITSEHFSLFHFGVIFIKLSSINYVSEGTMLYGYTLFDAHGCPR